MMAQPAAIGLKRDFVSHLMETARLLRHYVDRRAREHGTTRAQWLLLLRLSEREGMSQVELAELLELKPISLVPILDKLAEQGMLRRMRCPTDRRANRLHLTEAGRRAVSDLDDLRNDIAVRVTGEVEGDCLEAVVALLSRVKNRVKTEQLAEEEPA